MSNTYFLTGALGCIGASVVKHLVERGDTPIVFDLSSDPRRIRDVLGPEAIKKVKFVSGDITDQTAVTNAVKNCNPKAIIHLAALQVPFCKADPALGARVNVVGTVHVFEAAVAANVERVVYASSAAVFGPGDTSDAQSGPDENSGCNPTTLYGVYKLANEGTARVYWYDKSLSSVGIRPLTVYGVGRDQGLTSGPTSAMKAAVLGRPYTIKFSGETDFQHVSDVAAAFVRCADGGPAGAKVYNIHGETVAVADIVNTIAEIQPSSVGQIKTSGPKLPIPPRLDGDAIHRDYPGLPVMSLRDGIAETMRRFRELQDAGELDSRDIPDTAAD